MAKQTSHIIKPGNNFAVGRKAPMINPEVGGQAGFVADYQNIVGNTQQIKRNVVSILLAAPEGFKLMPDGELMISILKELIEEQALTVSGLDSTITVEYAETAHGAAGEMHEDPSNVTRARSALSYTWREKQGYSINTFFEEGWIFPLLGDPETKTPTIVQIADTPPEMITPALRGMTVLNFETDHTHTKVTKAWITTNMMPKTGGENVGSKELTGAGDGIDVAIEFTGITMVGVGVIATAQEVLDEMNITNVNPKFRPSIMSKPSTDVEAASTGAKAHLAAAKDEFVVGKAE